MAARSVKGADSPYRLSALVPTDGWSPVDARVVVSNVPELARKLGGESLYGPQPQIALRELIQNASDATRALESLTGITPPGIKVVLRADGDSWWLDVIDNGIGMSQQLLAGPLLDFGRSYWGSRLMRQESPGLASSGYQPAGRYGIGFYAAFMVGREVKVTSRRFDAASLDTRVLYFPTGLDARPIIRPAIGNEVRLTGGTTVSIKLEVEPRRLGGLLGKKRTGERLNLRELCGRLAPALTTSMVTQEENKVEEVCVSRSDWKSMPDEELLLRLAERNAWPYSFGTPIEEAAAALRTIERDGEVIARAALMPSLGVLSIEDGLTVDGNGVIVSGGLVAGNLQNVMGIFLGSPLKADRESGIVSATHDEIKEWASGQARIWRGELYEREFGWTESVELLAGLGADINGIGVCCTNERYLDLEALSLWAEQRTEIIALDGEDLDVIETNDGLEIWEKVNHAKINIEDDTLVIFSSNSVLSYASWGGPYPTDDGSSARLSSETDEDEDIDLYNVGFWWAQSQGSLSTIIAQTIAKAWGLDVETMLGGCFSDFFRATCERTSVDQSNVVNLSMSWRLKKPMP